MTGGRWFFRVIESDDGQWSCRRGRHEIDSHSHLVDALAHMTETAQASVPSYLYVHHHDGRVSMVAEFD